MNIHTEHKTTRRLLNLCCEYKDTTPFDYLISAVDCISERLDKIEKNNAAQPQKGE